MTEATKKLQSYTIKRANDEQIAQLWNLFAPAFGSLEHINGSVLIAAKDGDIQQLVDAVASPEYPEWRSVLSVEDITNYIGNSAAKRRIITIYTYLNNREFELDIAHDGENGSIYYVNASVFCREGSVNAFGNIIAAIRSGKLDEDRAVFIEAEKPQRRGTTFTVADDDKEDQLFESGKNASDKPLAKLRDSKLHLSEDKLAILREEAVAFDDE